SQRAMKSARAGSGRPTGTRMATRTAVRLPAPEVELALALAEPHAGPAVARESRAHPERVRLPARGVVDRVVRVLHDPLDREHRLAVRRDLAAHQVPARLALDAMRGAQHAVLHLAREALGVALGVVIVVLQRRAGQRDVPGAVERGGLR